MSRTKQISKRKHRSKAAPFLGAAGLSLTLASETSLASTAPVLDTMTRNAGISHQITLREEKVCDISLATFHVFDKEGTKTFWAGGRGCCLFACLAGQSGAGPSVSGNDAYSLPAPRPTRPAHKHVRRKP